MWITWFRVRLPRRESRWIGRAGLPDGPFDGGGAVVGSEPIGGPEPPDVADLAEDDRGAHVTGAEDLGERRA
jgi:hypothetical protein